MASSRTPIDDEFARRYREKIEQAFATVSHPGPRRESIIVCDCGECTEIYNDLKGKTWQRIKLSRLEWGSTLGMITPAAFHYFLPAFLLGPITDPDVYEVFDMEHMLEEPINDYLRARHLLLDADQCRAVIEFLQLEAALAPTGYERQDRTIRYWERMAGDSE